MQNRLDASVKVGSLETVSREPGKPEMPLRRAAEQRAPIARLPINGLAPSLDRKRLQFYLYTVLGDVALIIGSFALVSLIYAPPSEFMRSLLPAYLLLPIFLSLALQNGTYSLGSLTDWKRSALRMVFALLLSAALLNFFAFFARMNTGFSRVVFLASIILALIAMGALRFGMGRIVRATLGPSPVNRLVIHAGGPDVRLPHVYRVNAEDHALRPDLGDPEALNRFAHYICNMDEVLISCAPEQRLGWAAMLKGSGVHGEVISDFAHEIGALGIVRHHSANLTSLLISTGPLGLRGRAVKRIFDLSISGAALLLCAPLMAAVALAIKLEDGGPIFFRQRRVGRGNRFFDIYKFRSMRIDGADPEGARSAARGDDRVTRVGRFIRKSSIDELPQLINVVKGDMSLVGPRPHALGSQAGSKLFWQVDTKYWQRHVLRPGITGLAQIRGYRGATDTEGKLTSRLQADLEYLTDWSIWRDLRILFATFGVIVHEQAY